MIASAGVAGVARALLPAKSNHEANVHANAVARAVVLQKT